ncbi:MAG: arginine N-succinyltransferase, partial [Burkholderiales bacterium PBB5]
RLIGELPGRGGATGPWPFWQGLGRHFYAGDVLAAARRFGPAWRGHVAALLPRQPVVWAFLDEAAQAAIAQVAPHARVLVQVLWQAGLRYGHHIGIVDGGPVFELPLDQLQATR